MLWDLFDIVTFGNFEKKKNKNISNSTQSRNHTDVYENRTGQDNSSTGSDSSNSNHNNSNTTANPANDSGVNLMPKKALAVSVETEKAKTGNESVKEDSKEEK